MINALMLLATPIFNSTLMQNSFRAEDTHSTSYRNHIENSFSELTHFALAKRIAPALISELQFILATFVDEWVLKSNAPFKHEWQANPLQLHYFGEHLGGEEFFNRLNVARLDSLRNIDVLEIYYYCLQLGFEGIYRFRGQEKLQMLLMELRQQIELTRSEMKQSHSLQIRSSPSKAIRHLPNISLELMALLFTLILLLIYIGYSITASLLANRIITRIEANQFNLLSASVPLSVDN